jgi:opacity protein-like surface antigen
MNKTWRIKMNKCFLMTAILSTAITFSAYAGTDMKQMQAPAAISPSDAGFYVAAYGGAQFDTGFGDNRQTLSYHGENITSSNTIKGPPDWYWGGAGGIKGGYNFESFPICDTMKIRLQPAVETEALWLSAGSKSTFTGPYGSSAADSNNFNSAAWFINGILRFKNSSIVTPYIGIGAGGQYLTIGRGQASTNIPGYSHVTGLNGSDLDFAGQALAGFDFAIADHWSIFTEYKFIDAIGTDAKTNNVAGVSGLTYRFKPDQIQQNLVVAGVKYSF